MPVPAASERPRTLILAALAAAVTAAAFLPSLGGAFLNFDDDANFLNNVDYRGLGLSHLRWMFTTHFGHYMPLTWLSLGLDYVLWGMNPLGYHLTSLLLHSANAALWFFVLREILMRALPAEAPRSWDLGAFVGALFFSIHPLRAESVAWITERRDVLSGVFFLASVLAYLKSTRSPQRRSWLGISAAAFASSMLSKAMGMTLPLVLLLLDAWPLRRYRREPLPPLLLEKIPFFAIMVVAAALSFWAQNSASAVYSAEDYPLTQSLAQPGYRLSFYVVKTLFPIGLSPLYFYRPVLGAAQAGGWVAVLSITALLLAQRRRYPAPAVAWFSYLLLISPVSGFAQAGPHSVADRYTYLATLPFAALVGGVLAMPTGAGFRRVAAGAAIAGLLGLGALTVRQCGYWTSSLALWNRAIEIEPDVYFSRRNRGSARMEASDLPGAIADFDRAIELNPRYPNSWYGRGIARASLGNHAGAVEDLTVALRLAPDQAGSYSARGLSRAKLGDRAGAMADAEEALRLHPDYFQPVLHRGLIRFTFGDFAGAAADFTRAIQLDPTSPIGPFNLGLAEARLGRPAEAIADYTRALELRPDYAEALAQRGLTRALLRDPKSGLADLTESLRLKPDASTLQLRAAVRGMLSDFRGAVDDFDEALRMKPDEPDLLVRRGAAFLELGDRPAAARDFRKALDLAPADWPQRRAAEDFLRRALEK